MSVKKQTRTVDTIDLTLPAGRMLRVQVEREPDGEPGMVTLAEGWTDPARPDQAHTVRLPGDRLGELRDALRVLEEGGA